MTQEQAAKLATLSHNTTFSPRDAREYGLKDLRTLVRKGLVERVSQGQYRATDQGWDAINLSITQS